MSEPTADATELLRPYLPRMLLQWIADAPGTTLREIDGTVVFVDISGLTKMSERLARKGKSAKWGSAVKFDLGRWA